jgi:hypothetical protein
LASVVVAVAGEGGHATMIPPNRLRVKLTNRIRSPLEWKGEMQADKSLLEHMTDAMSDFAARKKKTAKKVKRTMAGRPPKKTKSSAGRKAVGKNKRAKKTAKRTTKRGR